ncbi:unnamed protein product [Clonostachys solani]|uniref:Uncharacterized protein n=1 Tax=Clonostachys solani TaxID=160281 RepID=A0A9N9YV43_9HYPO|nr:unnamed protein product [Clonostachys solani]
MDGLLNAVMEPLLHLGRGVRSGILSKLPILSEDKYQQFIHAFCGILQEFLDSSCAQTERDNAIRGAYLSARRPAFGDIDFATVPKSTKRDTTDEVLMVEMQENINLLQSLIDAVSRRADSLAATYSSKPLKAFDHETGAPFRILANTCSADVAREAVSQIAPMLSMESKATLSDLEDLLIDAQDYSIMRMKKLCNTVSDDKLDENEMYGDEGDEDGDDDEDGEDVEDSGEESNAESNDSKMAEDLSDE